LETIKILVRGCAEIGVQLGDERDHAWWQGLGGAARQLGRLDKQWWDDYLFVQRQCATDLVE
jgi:hypothetical protein